jgi:hypothetical protein
MSDTTALPLLKSFYTVEKPKSILRFLLDPIEKLIKIWLIIKGRTLLSGQFRSEEMYHLSKWHSEV